MDDAQREAMIRIQQAHAETGGVTHPWYQDIETLLRLLDSERKRADELELESEGWKGTAFTATAKAQTAEARCAGLETALREVAQAHDAGRHDGLPEPCPALDADTMFAIARAALAASPEPTPVTKEPAR